MRGEHRRNQRNPRAQDFQPTYFTADWTDGVLVRSDYGGRAFSTTAPSATATWTIGGRRPLLPDLCATRIYRVLFVDD